jgi:hypothetical protein
MLAVALKIDLDKLAHPEADLRYQLPARLENVTDGLIKDDGYDYTEDGALILFLTGDDERVLEQILKVLLNEPFQGNDLKAAIVVAADVGSGYSVVYPPDYSGDFVVEH